MENLNELKKWIEIGFEPTPTTKSIINKINNLIQKQMENENNKKGEWRNDPENYEAMSEGLGIDLEKHIRLKLDYNKTRPYKHNKNY